MYVVVSVNDEKYKPLADWTVFKNKKVYCERHGYVLKHYEDGAESLVGKPMRAGNPPIPEDHLPIGWAKVYAMKDAFEKYPDCEWIFNTDCDVMITNMTIKLEDIVNECTKDANVHVIIPADCNGINCGNMFIKNSPIGKAFLDTIIAGLPLYREWYLFENQLIQDLCVGTHLTEQGVKAGGTLWGRVIKLLPQRVFNSYDYKKIPLLKDRPQYKDILGHDGQWKEGDFIIQWPSTDLDYRIKEAEELYNSQKIIS
jgi:hypothetical protein|tara:strand:- start:4268 stop:5035 length:768 start_codon:yes stop_codon:yes gene_type:complete